MATMNPTQKLVRRALRRMTVKQITRVCSCTQSMVSRWKHGSREMLYHTAVKLEQAIARRACAET